MHFTICTVFTIRKQLWQRFSNEYAFNAIAGRKSGREIMQQTKIIIFILYENRVPRFYCVFEKEYIIS